LEGGCIWIAGGREGRNPFPGELIAGALPRGTAAQQINGGIVDEPEEKRPLLADALQQAFIAGELEEDFLEQIAGVRLVPREVQEKGMERLGVFVIEPSDVQAGGHFHNDAPERGICLGCFPGIVV
jgi:hypothetical protein